MSSGSITRAALGSTASLGHLYDARRDDFCGISIFKKSIPPSAMTLTDSHFSDIHMVHTDDFSEKVTKLDVNAELQVSVLAGLFRLEGSGRYLNDQKRSARTVKSSLIYNIKTKQESVNIYHEDLKDAFAIDAIESGIATHVVVEISWGANSIVSCLCENSENRDVKEIGGSLSARLKMLSVSISGGSSVGAIESEIAAGVKFDVRMYGDILSKNEELPTTFEGALQLMKKLPTLVETSNGGRGKPLSYRLIPISLLKSYLNFSVKVDTTLKTLEEASLIRVVQLFDQMTKAQQKLNDFYQDSLDFHYCFKPEDLTKISALKDEMTIQESTFRSELSTILTNIRSGVADISQLESLLQKFHSSDVSPGKVTLALVEWKDVIERINLVRSMVQGGAKFIGFGASLDEQLLKDFDAKLFVFYFSQHSKKEDPERWGGNRQLFFQEMKKQNENHKYYAIDCDIHPHRSMDKHFGSSFIQVIQKGHVVVEDLLAEHKKLGQTSFAQSISHPEKITHKPGKLTPLAIVCTGNNCSPSRVYEWTCTKCLETFQYGFDHYVYCDCGRSPAASLEFKCCDPMHGVAFENHVDAYLFKLLANLRQFGGINILVLGDAGDDDDKTTWINGIARFLKNTPMECTDMTVVDMGTCVNAFHPNIYPYKVDNTTIRFIDLVTDLGEGGHQGQDIIFKKSMAAISYLDEIHGICILFNPDNPQMNSIFRSCVKHVATGTGKNPGKNVMFCVNRSPKTCFRPEEIRIKLKKLTSENKAMEMHVSDNTVYYFSTEALQFNNIGSPAVELSGEQKLKLGVKWEKSVAEAKKMLKRIRELEPVPINDLERYHSPSVEEINNNVATGSNPHASQKSPGGGFYYGVKPIKFT